MAKHRDSARLQTIQRIISRPGEGTPIGIVNRQPMIAGVAAGVSLGLDLTTARVPDRRYVATAAAIAQEGDRITLIFGQHKLGGKGYRSLLLIEFPSNYVDQFLIASQELVDSIKKIAEQNSFLSVPLSDISEDVPGQTIPFVANIATAGYTDRDACMDFYYASPFAVQIAGMGGEFSADPVVRVTLQTALMMSIYERLSNVRGAFHGAGAKEKK